MVRPAMGVSWTVYGTHLTSLTLLVLLLEIHGCWSLNSEGLALLQFREKVEFDPYGVLTNWNPDECDPCMWSGVHCLNGRVFTLDLNGHDLKGVLAPELGNLTHLRFLGLSKNRFSGTIPHQFGRLMDLEILDLRHNNLTGTIPAELGGLHSLRSLLLCDNKFEGSIPVEIGKLSLLTDVQFDENLTIAASGIGCINRKIGLCMWQSVSKHLHESDSLQLQIKGTIIRYLNQFPLFKFRSEPLDDADDNCDDLTSTYKSGIVHNIKNQVNTIRRKLTEQPSNLAAIPPNFGTPALLDPNVSLPSRSSGSFPAIPNRKELSPPPISSPNARQEHKPTEPSNSSTVSQSIDKKSLTDGKSEISFKLLIGISCAVFLLMVVVALFVICKSRAARNIGPWKTGLSGQLQKAFITGVPKLNRAELETACEDFSNIINTYEGSAIVYKGTLSSGVEIAVVSTVIQSLKDWSKRSELAFRKKIDSLSRVNHKNFVNLIGYCEEDEPFTRMMVFEYAPNGALFEHLHVEEVEHLDWNTRMRVIMGTAYCLQYMHDLKPPIPHYNLNSSEILLTDDYAAKIADISFWAELVAKSMNHAENETEHSRLPPPADVGSNIHSFGILLLEIISGKLPHSEEQGHLENWAAQYLNDKKTISYLIDPTLKAFKDEELDIVCEVIQSCIQQDSRKRPCMKELIQKLRQAIDVSPEAATPRLSPLWWAELEILSAEAA
ncbi:protein MALE DISCOVERER 2-like [Henckelia pumila]|uniref:protein MALE DISCOVERER 2-like n=1 Tax=Henckelia pumila TaxID=405737 RepID=UPI003C6E419F